MKKLTKVLPIFVFVMVLSMLFALPQKVSAVNDTIPKKDEVDYKMLTRSLQTDNAKLDADFRALQEQIATQKDKPVTGWQLVLVFLPLIIFLALSLFMIMVLKKQGYKLSDALSEDASYKGTTVAKTDGTTEGGEAEGSQTSRSTSRLVVFLSSVMSVIIAVCLCSFFLYFYFSTGKAPELDNMLKVMLSLGVGTVPYAIKQISK